MNARLRRICLHAIISCVAFAVQAAERPNVLFIAVDDMRCELGCYGAKHVHSPNMDRLAASSVLFNRAYCQQAVCNPSRVSLMTGLRPDSTRVWDLATEMRTALPDVVTLPQHFRQHGYRAVAYGKIFHNPFPDAASWDEPTHNAQHVVDHSEANLARLAAYREKMRAEGKSGAAIERMRGPATEMQEQPDDKNFDGKQTSDALAKLRELAAGQSPFFLAVGYIRPHLPFITPKKYWDLYERAKLSLAANPQFPKDMPPVAFGERNLGGFYELRDYMDYADAPSPFERPLTEAQQRELRHGYYASVSFVDAQVGRLLAGLDELKLAQNTILVLWSDHGWKLGEHGGWCKQTNFEIDTRAPLMIRAPGAKANGQKCDALVEFVDIYPTLCELTGLPVPKTLEGMSLKPLLDGSAAKVKDAAFSQFPRQHEGRDHMGYAMRTDRYRYVEWLDAKSGAITSRELYDHANDATENENIAARPENAALLAQLSAQLWKRLPRPAFPHPFLKSTAAPAPAGARAAQTWHPSDGRPLPVSRPAGEALSVTFTNARTDVIELIWLGADGARRSYATLKAGETFTIRTRPGAVWQALDTQQMPLGHFVIEQGKGNAATVSAETGKNAAKAATTLPNIVYILADDLGYGDLGCYNKDSKIPTPNLDRLAREGMRFTDAHAPTSVCTPTRYAILTGRYSWRTRLQRNVLGPWDAPLIAPERLTVEKLLQQHGYATACIGKWHLGVNFATTDGKPPSGGPKNPMTNVDFSKPIADGPITRGFDHYFGTLVPNYPPYCFIENDRTVGIPSEREGTREQQFNIPGPMVAGWKLVNILPELTRHAVTWIEDTAKTKRSFFLYLPLTSPHFPVVPAPEFIGKSKAGAYGDFVFQTDWTVGQVLDALKRAGIAEHTLVIFTSDNGPEVVEINPGAYDRAQQFHHDSMGSLRGAKRDAWEGGHRVPFLARWPGRIKAGAVSDETVCHVDFMATVAAILGATLPDNAAEDSVNVLPVLLGEKLSVPTREATVHHSGNGKFAIRKGDWVLIDAPTGDDNGAKGEPPWLKDERGYAKHDQPGELFNVREDLAERHNYFAEKPQLASELKSLLEKYKRGGRSTPGAPQPNDVEIAGHAAPQKKRAAK